MKEAYNRFNKALLLLDYGKEERGERVLREAIELANEEGDISTLIGAQCCLGDFLMQKGDVGEAKIWLEAVVNFDVPPDSDDLFDEEIRQAKQLLANGV